MGVTAYFDFDGTVLDGDSDEMFHAHTRAAGRLTPRMQAVFDEMLRRYRAGELTAESFAHFQVERSLGWTPEAFAAAGAACFHKRARVRLFPEALDWVRWHKARAHRVVLLSGGPASAIAAAGRHLEADAAYGCAVAVEDGAFVEDVVTPMPFGAGKIAVAQADALRSGCRLEDCYFYADGRLDLPLLRAVGHPVAVNPDPVLGAAAAAADWPVHRPRRASVST